jgi:hypothetical protein
MSDESNVRPLIGRAPKTTELAVISARLFSLTIRSSSR